MLKNLIAISSLIATFSISPISALSVQAHPDHLQRQNTSRIAKINVGVLKADDPDSRINLRSKPTTKSKALGYGLTGDGVEIIGCSSEFGDTWLEVKFIRPPHATGWVRADFILTSISLEYC